MIIKQKTVHSFTILFVFYFTLQKYRKGHSYDHVIQFDF